MRMEVSSALHVLEASRRRGGERGGELVEGNARVHVVDRMIIHVPRQPFVRWMREHNAGRVPRILVVVGGLSLIHI